MKNLKKNVVQSILISLMTICLLFTGGCSVEVVQDLGEIRNSVLSMNEDTAEQVEDDRLQVQFLDVGQGSATLLHQGNSWMLIDGGDRDYSSYVVSYLKKLGITSLDYVVATHYDSDHLSGLVGVLKNFECKQILTADYKMDTKTYKAFWEVVKNKKIPVTYPKQKEEYPFADSTLEIIGPAYYGYEDSNSNSIGIRIRYGENTFLVCGDCTEESEQDLLYQRMDVDSDVFVVNHHGSKHSNTKEFIEAVSPDSAIISCGPGNDYGHPHAPVMLTLQEQGVELYRTDLQGTITAISDGETITFKNKVCMDYRSGREIKEVPKKPDGLTDIELETKIKYVLNITTMKFHLPDCSSVEDIEEKNKEYSKGSRESLIKQGYEPCKRCEP